jgi:hypothetical protein
VYARILACATVYRSSKWGSFLSLNVTGMGRWLSGQEAGPTVVYVE